MDIWQFFVKYWLEWAFGLIASGVLVGAKFYVRAKQKDFLLKIEEVKNKAKAEVIAKLEGEIKAVSEESAAADKRISGDLEHLSLDIDNITAGLLSLQGKQFKEQCREYLQPEYVISVDEFEQLTEDHAAYNALGGNHKGDALFESVKTKFNAQVSK